MIGRGESVFDTPSSEEVLRFLHYELWSAVDRELLRHTEPGEVLVEGTVDASFSGSFGSGGNLLDLRPCEESISHSEVVTAFQLAVVGDYGFKGHGGDDGFYEPASRLGWGVLSIHTTAAFSFGDVVGDSRPVDGFSGPVLHGDLSLVGGN